VNINRTDTVLSPRDSSRPDSVPRRVIRLLARGPAELNSPTARWAVTILAIVGAVLAVWSGEIHLQLWSDGYQDIAVIGPLFLIQGIGSIVVGIAVVIGRRLVLIAAGAVALAATAVGLLISVNFGLFGIRESLAVPYAKTSLVEEFVGAAVLLAAAAILLLWPRRFPGNP
jgi:hypothetical protein